MANPETSILSNFFNGIQSSIGIETDKPTGIVGKAGEWALPFVAGAFAHGRLVARPAIEKTVGAAGLAQVGSSNFIAGLTIGK